MEPSRRKIILSESMKQEMEKRKRIEALKTMQSEDNIAERSLPSDQEQDTLLIGENKRSIVSVLKPIPELPAFLKPKHKEKPIRFTTYIEEGIYENLRTLKERNTINSISALVNAAINEYLTKYNLY